MKIRKEPGKVIIEKLLNIEIAWDRNSLSQTDTAISVPGLIDEDHLIRVLISKSKYGKAAGPAFLLWEMVKAAGEVEVDMITGLVNSIIVGGVIPTE